jgi:hypothetical protein
MIVIEHLSQRGIQNGKRIALMVGTLILAMPTMALATPIFHQTASYGPSAIDPADSISAAPSVHKTEATPPPPSIIPPPAQVNQLAREGGVASPAQPPTPLPDRPLPRMAETPKLIAPALHAVSLAFAQADIGATISRGQRNEQDPLAKPFTSLPAPGYEAAGMALAVGFNLLADRANRSPRFHRFARSLLYAQIAANAAGFSYTLAGVTPAPICTTGQNGVLVPIPCPPGTPDRATAHIGPRR